MSPEAALNKVAKHLFLEDNGGALVWDEQPEMVRIIYRQDAIEHLRLRSQQGDDPCQPSS